MLRITEQEKKSILSMYQVINEQDAYLDKNTVQPLLAQGYKPVDKIAVSDGPYILVGAGYLFDLTLRDRKTGYKIVLVDGIKSATQKEIPVMVEGGQIVDFFPVYKMLYKAPSPF
jgi:hypothetical protein